MQHTAFAAHRRHPLASVVAQLDGQLVREERVEHERGALTQFLTRCERGSPVAVETTRHWYWIVDEIEAAGFVPSGLALAVAGFFSSGISRSGSSGRRSCGTSWSSTSCSSAQRDNAHMGKKNALLVYPEFATSFWSFKFALQYVGKQSSMPSLGLLTLASMFSEDYDLRLVDMNVRPLMDADLHWADLICTSTMIVQSKSLAQVIARAKRAGKPVVAGGPHPTSYWEVMKDVDYFLLGEVEETFPRFLHDLENGTAKHIYVPREKPAITQTPLPRFDLVNMRAYGSMLLQFSRGCPFDCEFCDITKLYGRVPRTKTPEQMLAEFTLLYDLVGAASCFSWMIILSEIDAMPCACSEPSSPGSVNATIPSTSVPKPA